MKAWIEFEAGYGRTGIIEVLEIKCDAGDKKEYCLCIDSSEGEYSAGSICQRCSSIMFNLALVKHTKLKLGE